VLDVGQTGAGLHVYAQCLRSQPGGVSVLAINTGEADAALEVGAPAEVYTLSATPLESGTVLLNGRSLAVGPVDRVPELRPRRVKAAPLMLAPKSIDFIALPRARNPNCK
jgi:hypothetical protein